MLNNKQSSMQKRKQGKQSSFTAQQLADIHRIFRKGINDAAEVKYYPISSSVQAVDSDITDTADAYFFLRGIAQGTNDYQRIGDKIRLKSIAARGGVSLFLSAANVWFGKLTILVLNCKTSPQASGATMPWTSLLKNQGAYNAWTGLATDRLQLINEDDFELLHREDHNLEFSYNSAATLSYMTPMNEYHVEFDINLNMNNRLVDYSEGTTVPSAYNPFICFAITNADYSTNASSTYVGKMSMWQETLFTDV